MEVKYTVLPAYQPLTLAFTVVAQLCDPKANELEMGLTLLSKNGEGRRRSFDFDFWEERN